MTTAHPPPPTHFPGASHFISLRIVLGVHKLSDEATLEGCRLDPSPQHVHRYLSPRVAIQPASLVTIGTFATIPAPSTNIKLTAKTEPLVHPILID